MITDKNLDFGYIKNTQTPPKLQVLVHINGYHRELGKGPCDCVNVGRSTHREGTPLGENEDQITRTVDQARRRLVLHENVVAAKVGKEWVKQGEET